MAESGSTRALREFRAFVLAGGAGTRLRSVVTDIPKALAPVAGRPFIEYVLCQLADQGIPEVIICTGVGSDAIRRYTLEHPFPTLRVALSEESTPLGTAGALRLAVERFADDALLVLNGDSFFDVRFDRLFERHRDSGADVTMAVRWTRDPGRFGSVAVDREGWVTSFREKVSTAGPSLINGGVFVLNRDVLADLPLGEPRSIEQDVFPALVGRGGRGRVATVAFEGWFTDIGVPSDYHAVNADPRPMVAALKGGSAC